MDLLVLRAFVPVCTVLVLIRAGAEYFVVRFTCDQAVSTVPAKMIVEPPSSTLKVGQQCKVEWKEKKSVETYDATVLAMGKRLVLCMAL